MGPLGAVIATFVASDIGLMLARIKRNSLFWAVASVFFLTSYVFFLAAASLYLTTLVSPLQAVLIIGGGSLLIALILLAIMYSMEASERRVATERRRKAQLQSNVATAAALTLFRRKPLMAAGVAVGLGAALSFLRKPGGRD